jgi:plasmid maintenance system antidote protein VapI
MGISINKLVRDIAVPPGRISAILNETCYYRGHRAPTEQVLWLGLQADFDLRVAKRTVGARIDKQVRAHVA